MGTTSLTRRNCLIGGGLVATVPAPSRVRATGPTGSPVDVSRWPVKDPAYNTALIGRLQGDLSGRQRILYNPGYVFATQPGQGLAPAEFGRLLYRVEGVTMRISRLLADGSVEERSDSWMFYRDAENEAYLETFVNPFSGERLDVPPHRGGSSRSRLVPAQGAVLEGASGLESTAIGAPVRLSWRAVGEHVFLTRHAASRVRPPEGPPRNEFSIDAWVVRAVDLLDDRLTHLPSTYSWTSQGEWQPWLRMQGRPGGLIWRIESAVLDSPAELPASFVARIRRLLPGKLDARLAF